MVIVLGDTPQARAIANVLKFVAARNVGRGEEDRSDA